MPGKCSFQMVPADHSEGCSSHVAKILFQMSLLAIKRRSRAGCRSFTDVCNPTRPVELLHVYRRSQASADKSVCPGRDRVDISQQIDPKAGVPVAPGHRLYRKRWHACSLRNDDVHSPRQSAHPRSRRYGHVPFESRHPVPHPSLCIELQVTVNLANAGMHSPSPSAVCSRWIDELQVMLVLGNDAPDLYRWRRFANTSPKRSVVHGQSNCAHSSRVPVYL
jgi:hypothetical protein